MFCTKCGNELQTEAAFCTSCGNAATKSVADTESFTEQVSPETLPKNTIWKGVLIASYVLWFIIGIPITFFGLLEFHMPSIIIGLLFIAVGVMLIIITNKLKKHVLTQGTIKAGCLGTSSKVILVASGVLGVIIGALFALGLIFGLYEIIAGGSDIPLSSFIFALFLGCLYLYAGTKLIIAIIILHKSRLTLNVSGWDTVRKVSQNVAFQADTAVVPVVNLPAPGKNYLLVTGILMIVFGILQLPFALFAMSLDILDAPVFVILACFGIYAGIMGIVNRKKAKKGSFLIKLGIAYIVLLVAANVNTPVYDIFDLLGSLLSFVNPILYILGAAKNDKTSKLK